MTERMTNRTERILDPTCAPAIQSQALPPKRPPQNQQVTPLPKLHRTDEGRLYLRSALQHTLAKVESDPAPLDKKKWRDYERLRQLIRMYRQTGRMNWSVLWWAFGTAAAVALILYVKAPKSYIYAAPTDTYRVLEQITGYEFVMQRVHEGIPQAPELKRFCMDYRPRFEPGMSLIWFAYEDRGECVSIAAKDRGYVIDRGPDHWPKLAKNCKNPGVSIPVVCDGKPIFD